MTSSSTARIVALRCLVSGHQLPGLLEVWAVWTMLLNPIVMVLRWGGWSQQYGSNSVLPVGGSTEHPVQSVLAHKMLTPHALC